MPVLEIDGVGRVEVGKEFLSLSPDRQASEVDTIASMLRKPVAPPVPSASGPAVATPGAPVTAETAKPGSEEADFLATLNRQPAPDELATRGSILPLGRTKEGQLVPALPEFIEGPRKTIVDLLEGRRSAKDITGKEIFELGALFGGVSSATGTGAGIARSSAQRSAAKTAETAAPAEAAAVPAAAETAVAAPAVAAPVEATAAPSATRGGLHSTAETLAMRGASKKDFTVLDESNIVLDPKSFKPLTKEIFSEASTKGLDPTITPNSTAALKRLTDIADQPVTLQTLNTMREVAGAAAGSNIPKDRMIAEIIIDRLDNYMNGLKTKDLMLGSEADAQAVAQAVTKARKTWSEVSKLEVVSRLVQRAKDSVANRPSLGIENTLRTEFTNLAKNDAQMRKFMPDEREAIRQINKGATKAAARAVGRLAPTGPVSGLAVGGLATVLGAKIGLDPLSSMMVIGAPAFGARKLAGALTLRSVKRLEDVIKAGGSESSLAKSAAERGRTVVEQLRANLETGASAKAATAGIGGPHAMFVPGE